MSNLINKTPVELYLQRKKFWLNQPEQWERTPHHGRAGILESSRIFIVNEQFLQNCKDKRITRKLTSRKEHIILLHFLVDPLSHLWYVRWRGGATVVGLYPEAHLINNTFLLHWYSGSIARKFLSAFVGRFIVKSKNFKFKGLNFFKKNKFSLFHHMKLRFLLLYINKSRWDKKLDDVATWGATRRLNFHRFWMLDRKGTRLVRFYPYLIGNFFIFFLKCLLFRVHFTKEWGKHFTNTIGNLLRLKLVCVFWLTQNFIEITRGWNSQRLWWLSLHPAVKSEINGAHYLKLVTYRRGQTMSPLRIFFKQNLLVGYLTTTKNYHNLTNRRVKYASRTRAIGFPRPYGRHGWRFGGMGMGNGKNVCLHLNAWLPAA